VLIRDFIRLTTGSITYQRMRSFLTGLGIAVGIAAVVFLTSIGEGLNRFVISEFTQFGTNLIGINPGRVTTMGTPLGVLGSVRLLTLGDVEALRRVPHAESVIPWIWGNAEVESGGKRRRTTIYGVGPEMPVVLRIDVSAGRFLPADDAEAPRAFAVLGSKMRKELFGTVNPLGKRIRIGGYRFRVIGTMESKGQILGFDLDDTVYIPTVRGMELFNREGLMEIDVLYSEGASVDEVAEGIRRVLIARHGQEDFTITTQQQMLDVLGSVLDVLTIAVSALGGISLLVGSVGILTVMTISVNERTAEIGLLRALGAGRMDVLILFLGEAVVLGAIGGLAGMAVGAGGAQLTHFFLPALPVHISWFYVILAEVLATVIGLLSGILPAWRAAGMDPVEALRQE